MLTFPRAHSITQEAVGNSAAIVPHDQDSGLMHLKRHVKVLMIQLINLLLASPAAFNEAMKYRVHSNCPYT